MNEYKSSNLSRFEEGDVRPGAVDELNHFLEGGDISMKGEDTKCHGYEKKKKDT